MSAGSCAAALLLALSTLLAPAPRGAQQAIRTGTDAVPVDVLVTRDGRPVTGLTAADFELRDNGVAQEILGARLEDVPLTLMLVLDVSESVEGEPLAQLRSAIGAAAGALSADDRLALFTFSHHVTLAAAPTQDLAQVQSAAMRMSAGGATSLYDATFAAVAMRQRVPGRAVMLVFSDGADTTSWIDPRAALRSAQRSDIVVYGVSLRPQLERQNAQAVRSDTLEQEWFPDDPVSYGRQYLPLLAADTGGAMLTAERIDQLRETFVRVVTEFKSRYVLLYTPRGVEPDGWHSIDVKLKTQRADITARRGYLRGGK